MAEKEVIMKLIEARREMNDLGTEILRMLGKH